MLVIVVEERHRGLALAERYRAVFFFSSRRRHTIFSRDWCSDVCSSDLSGRFAKALMTCAWAWPPPSSTMSFETWTLRFTIGRSGLERATVCGDPLGAALSRCGQNIPGPGS